MTQRVTLKDVSKAAGVGMATVSRALADHPDVSVATRDRVRAIAQQLGYRPSVAARALRNGGFHAISVIVPDDGWGWWEPVVHSAFQAASAMGYQTFVHPIAGTEGGIAAVVEGLENIPTEGVIVISVRDQQAVRDACDRIGIPGIAIDDSSAELRFATVSPTNRFGAEEVVAHLVDQGSKRICFLRPRAGKLNPAWGEGLFIRERELGYRDALAAAGIPIDESLVVEIENSPERKPLCDELDQLLGAGIVPDAVFCAFDGLAAPVLRTLGARGFRVPADIAIAGFDDERAAVLLNPQLTTSRQPYDEMGRAAVELLLQAIAGGPVPIARHEFPTKLVVRHSTSSP
ncbi:MULTISPECIES: LacI family DNA-binding transcriptional regulator [unclassified Microbacterium]|uniref:LacI family DNA-binding transcriptional regulator n=1 Tax=unclassified Microbacterium TaxID=2609290 RepID=UPI003466E0FA